MIQYRWGGVDERGDSKEGYCSTADLAGFVEARYKRRWRQLSVTTLATGVEVGGISRLSPRKRTWWAENMLPVEFAPMGPPAEAVAT
jgi:hypothetical protein